MKEDRNVITNSKPENMPRKVIKSAGILIAFAGLAASIITYIMIMSGLLYDICTKTGRFKNYFGDDWASYVAYNKLVSVLLLIGMLSAPVLCIGFLMYIKWKEDLRFAKSKLIILSGFVLFSPAPLFFLGGMGLTPPVFMIPLTILLFLEALPNHYRGFNASMTIVSLIPLLNFLISLLMGHIFSSFVFKYIKKIYIHWIIFIILAAANIFGKYFWSDVGGGHHGGNILELFRDIF